MPKLKSLTFGALNLPFFIARRYMMNQKGPFSFIIRLGIIATTLSVAVMILSLAVVTGFTDTIKEKLYSFTGHVHVSYYDPRQSNALTSPPIYFDRKLLADFQHIPHVASVTPFVQRPVILQAHGRMEGLSLKGVGSSYHLPHSVSFKGKPIDYSDTFYSRQVLLSEETAAKLDVYAGDTIQLEFFDGGSLPRLRRVIISGLFHSGMEEVDQFYAICDLRLLQRINNWSADSINAYQLDLDNEVYSDTVANFIHYNLINAPLEATTTNENYSFIFDWLHLTSQNGVILLVIMSVVAVINMGSVLVILMVDRAAMVGLLKALGMTFRSTASIFLGIGGIIGATGIILGNILALSICWLQLRFGFLKLPESAYYMKYAPIKVIWWHVVVTDIAALVLFVLCMWLPALYIRTIQPAKVLQFK